MLARSLEEAGFAVDIAADGEDGLFRIREIGYDAVVLDLMLPRLDGWSVLEAARADGIRMPILVLTARDQLADRVRGLNLGADDYLVKPFAIAELIARLHALIRRAYGSAAATLTVGDLVIDIAARQVQPRRATDRAHGARVRDPRAAHALARRRRRAAPRSTTTSTTTRPTCCPT